MGMFSKLKDQFIDHDEYEDEGYEDEEMMEEEEEPQRPVRSAAPAVPRSVAARNVGRATVPGRQAKPYTMVVVNPKVFNDCEKIADHLKSSRPVVMNMEQTDDSIAQRIVDYVQGVMYALDGKIDRISESIYLCAPNNMSVSRENYADVKTVRKLRRRKNHVGRLRRLNACPCLKDLCNGFVISLRLRMKMI